MTFIFAVGAFCQNANEEIIHKPFFKKGDAGRIPGCFTTTCNGQAYYINGSLYDKTVENVEIDVYDDTFTKIKTFSVSSDIMGFTYENFNEGYEGEYLYLTQTLFNKDSEYEYFVPIKTKIDDYNDIYTGFRILSSNGSELARIDFEEEYRSIEYKAILRMGDNYYLTFELGNAQYEYITAVYAIDKTATEIKQVLKKKNLSINPIIARSSENINISIESSARERMISVISTNGGVIKQIALPAGQSSVSMDTTGVTPGMYIVNVLDGKREYESCKIIIR